MGFHHISGPDFLFFFVIIFAIQKKKTFLLQRLPDLFESTHVLDSALFCPTEQVPTATALTANDSLLALVFLMLLCKVHLKMTKATKYSKSRKLNLA